MTANAKFNTPPPQPVPREPLKQLCFAHQAVMQYLSSRWRHRSVSLCRSYTIRHIGRSRRHLGNRLADKRTASSFYHASKVELSSKLQEVLPFDQ